MFSFLCSVIAFLVSLWLLKVLKFLYHFHKIPGHWVPLHLQVFGLTLKLFNTSGSERFKLAQSLAVRYPGVAKVLFGNIFVLVVNDPEIARRILSSNLSAVLNKPASYDFFTFKNSLINSSAEVWRGHRKLLNKNFGLTALTGFLPIFERNAEKVVQKLAPFVGQGTFDPREIASSYTMDSICTTSFGASVGEDKMKPFSAHMLRLNRLTATRMFNLHLYSDAVFRKSKHWAGFIESFAYIFAFGNELIKKRRRLLNAPNRQKEAEEDEHLYIKKADIVVDRLIQVQDQNGAPLLSDSEIFYHSIFFLSAGSETNSQTIEAALVFLGMHPVCQELALAEIKRELGTDSELSLVNLGNLKYLEMVIKETLRLAPPAALYARVISEDVTLDGIFFPAGVEVLFSVLSMHRNPEYWGPDAERFNPDNFLPEREEQRPKYCYLPFSSGIRNCIGYRYSMLVIKIVLVRLLQSYEFSSPLKMEDLEFDAHLAVTITNPCSLAIKKRVLVQET